MKPVDHAELARAYLDELCRRLDRGQPLRRLRREWWTCTVLAPVAVGLAAGTASCGGTVTEHPSSTEVCTNQADDDGDGKIDCADSDCAGQAVCTSPEGGTQEVCNNAKDDDGDGKIDCADSDCVGQAVCTSPEGGTQEVCNNGKDDDGDGLVDCGDTDCIGFYGCAGDAYAAPFEGGALYAAPAEICDNGVDDDGDGLVDCGDTDCQGVYPCMGAEYAAPF